MADQTLGKWLAEGAPPRSSNPPSPAEPYPPAAPANTATKEDGKSGWRPGPEPPPRRRWLRGLAGGWAVGLVLIVVAVTAGREVALTAPGEGFPAGADLDAGTATPPAHDPVAPAAPPAGGIPQAPSPPASTEDSAAAQALAALAVRLALTTGGDAAVRYVDLVQPEAVERHGDTIVVTLTAVVLDGSEGRWDAVRPARYAVALADAGQGPTVLGPPWPLPAPPVAIAPPGPPDALDDPDRAAALGTALAAAGYREVTIVGLLTGPPPPLVRVQVEAVAPGEREISTHDVWLDEEPPARVLGLRP